MGRSMAETKKNMFEVDAILKRLVNWQSSELPHYKVGLVSENQGRKVRKTAWVHTTTPPGFMMQHMRNRSTK